MEHTQIIGSRSCSFRQVGSGGPVILLPEGRSSDLPALAEQLSGMLLPTGCTLVSVPVSDWSRELSPWPARAAFGEDFPGEGRNFLHWIEEALIPCLQNTPVCIAGYSLAGLFALWSCYETDLFSGAVCCSGSLWLDGWDTYAGSHTLRRKMPVYLSIGGKEEKAKQTLMASVGIRTRMQEKLLRADPGCTACTLQMNPGGHFADPTGRLAAGIAWLLQHVGV